MIRGIISTPLYGTTTKPVAHSHGITRGTHVVTRGYGVSVRGPRPQGASGPAPAHRFNSTIFFGRAKRGHFNRKRTMNMPGDPFYKSKAWLRLRAAVLRRDKYRCTICGEPARIVDHVVSRKRGGKDVMANLRSLCRTCDNRVKESATGQRRSGGIAVTGCFPDGSPRSPEHPWFTGGPGRHG